MRRFVSVLFVVAALAGVTATSALAWSDVYAPNYYYPGGYAHSEWDNCVYYYAEIGYNTFEKSVTRLGTSAVIKTNGTWVASAQDSNQDTIAFTKSSALFKTKKGYFKNTSSVAYSGQGEVGGSYLCAY